MSKDTTEEHHLETHGPIDLYVENRRGNVHLTLTDTTETTVVVTGRDADLVEVAHDHDHVSVIGPRQRSGFMSGGERSLDITITLPTHSRLTAKLGSCDLSAEGTLSAASVRTGSGDITLTEIGGHGEIETGSGDLRVDHARDGLRVKSGSGDVSVKSVGGALHVSTGSGDTHVTESHGTSVVKSGSGDFTIGVAHNDVSLSTGSGDLRVGTITRGAVTMHAASGDTQLGIPAGTPVWTDINTLTGQIVSDLPKTGEPEPGAPYVEVRAKTVSGDVVLRPA